jgi:hypothetical protein
MNKSIRQITSDMLTLHYDNWNRFNWRWWRGYKETATGISQKRFASNRCNPSEGKDSNAF